MENSMKRVAQWKRDNQAFDPTLYFVTHARFHQYLDTLLRKFFLLVLISSHLLSLSLVVDLGLSPHRKLPNLYSELFGIYGAGDYAHVFHEFERHLLTITQPLRPVDIDM
jgi:dimethylaniline monooxygenase (N-oxide forming)